LKKRAFFKEPVEPVNLLANLFAAAMFTQTMHRMGEPSTPPPQGGARQVARKEPQQARRDVRKEQQQAKRDAQKQAQPAAVPQNCCSWIQNVVLQEVKSVIG
jgi:hypothetical protein